MCKVAISLLLIFALSGCMIGPNYHRPEIDTPQSWRFEEKEANDVVKDTKWWEQFDDPVLNDLINIALQENKDVKIAAARIEEFMGRYGITRSTLFPQVFAGASAGRDRASEDGPAPALAVAFAQNGIVLYVPKGVVVEEPLHSVWWGPGTDLAHVSHILVLVDEGASVTYVHESASPDLKGANTMHAGIVEIQVLQDASMKFVELQSWGRHVWNFSHERARVERGGNLDWIFGAIGSRLTKNFSELDLAGEGATGRMSGFYFTDGTQHLDHDTQQNHLAPHTTSDLLFKGALKGKSRSHHDTETICCIWAKRQRPLYVF